MSLCDQDMALDEGWIASQDQTSHFVSHEQIIIRDITRDPDDRERFHIMSNTLRAPAPYAHRAREARDHGCRDRFARC